MAEIEVLPDPEDSFSLVGAGGDYDLLGAGGLEYDLVGAGIDADFLVKTAAELASRGIDTYNEQQASAATKKEIDAKTAEIIALDAAAVKAIADLAVAKRTGSLEAIAALQLVADQAQAALRAAAVGLPTAAAQRRVKAANEATAKAASVLATNPKSVPLLATATAAAQVAKLAAEQSVVAPAGPLAPAAPVAPPSFWTTKRWGLPTYAWIGGGVALAAVGTALTIRHLRRRA